MAAVNSVTVVDVLALSVVCLAIVALTAGTVWTFWILLKSQTVRVLGRNPLDGERGEAAGLPSLVRLGFPYFSQHSKVWWERDRCLIKYWIPLFTFYLEVPRGAVTGVVIEKGFTWTRLRFAVGNKVSPALSIRHRISPEDARTVIGSQGWPIIDP
jgi:hypothetical protein